jgi:hypothetical protein
MTKLLKFGEADFKLSESNKKAIEYWRRWLCDFVSQAPPIYRAKNHAWNHIKDAAKVDRGITLLLILVTKATHLMELWPGYYCWPEFQALKNDIEKAGRPFHLIALERIFQYYGFDEILDRGI